MLFRFSKISNTSVCLGPLVCCLGPICPGVLTWRPQGYPRIHLLPPLSSIPQRQGSCEPTSQPTPPAKHRPSVQKPLSHSSEPLGGPTSGALAPGQHVSPGAQHLPVGAEQPATGPPCPPAQVTSIKQPLKTLFKRLDPTASPFGS